MRHVRGSSNQSATGQAPWAPEMDRTANHPPWRVLVVDDNIHVREAVARFLSRYRYDVSQADNGRAALEMFQRAPCDLVITDLRMPVMDGATLTTRIKAISRDTPVVVITGQGRSAATEWEGIVSADAVLYKPFDLSILVATMRDLLSPPIPARTPPSRELPLPVSG